MLTMVNTKGQTIYSGVGSPWSGSDDDDYHVGDNDDDDDESRS